MFAQRLQSPEFILFVHEERNIVVAATVGNHPHRYLLECFERESLETAIAPFEVADDTHNHHVFIYGNGGELH